jgi:predicted helicase
MTTTIHTILEEFREAARSKRDLGDKFERLIANYLMTDPQYADRLSQVWLWHEWPHRLGSDVGIDLVAEEHGTGDYWAIQCKFYDPDHWLQKGDIDSFFTASGKRFATLEGERGFTNRLIVSTTDRWSKHAEEALADQAIPAHRLRVQDLADSPIDWSRFSLSQVDEIRLKPKKEPRPHQTEAIGLAVEAFQTQNRGKLIMACGTGKTFTSLRLAERVTPENARILFLAPSISLVAQTLREWTAEAETPIHAFVVCSDTKVGRDEEDLRTHDLAYPATTDARKIALHAGKLSPDRRIVVFSTYQSIQVLADAQKQGLSEFDLIICDEAHRTTGLTLPGEDPSDFNKVHHNHIVKAKKRLYMTATPRVYGEASKTKADENSAVLFSMDDPDIYGPEFYRLGFGKAVDKDLLSEYKVLIVAVEEDKMAALANAYNFDGEKAIDTRFATKIIGSWKGLSKRGLMLVDEDGQQEAATEDPAPMRRAVAFSRSIKDSKQTTEVFEKLVSLYLEKHVDDGGDGMIRCHLDHVDGTMNALKRQGALEWLKENPGEGQCRILSNARCLSEGIDVPALDAVVFFDTRESIVDIVQSVGRVMRKADGKKYGYIILPVGIPSSKVKDYNSYIDSDPQFKGIWKVIKALRAHDESLVDEAEFRRKIKVITDPARKRRGEGGDSGGEGGSRGGTQLTLDFPDLPIDAINEAVYAAIPKKLGDREYWSEWAKSVAQIAERLMGRIRELLANPEARTVFDDFLKGLRDNLNPAVGEDEAVEMLAQHVITRPVFEALFEGYSFTANNPVSKAMQAVLEVIDQRKISSETDDLSKFYDNLRDRVSLAKSDKSRQDIIRNLYDTFFGNAFPRMAERLGIVYTPVEVVDFIIRSAEAALRKHFGAGFTDTGVQILDPFTGTGTFIVRLLQSGLIQPEDLARKYKGELHANEIVLLAYYIAAINIESSYHALTGEYQPFDGIVLTDTFQTTENRDLVDTVILPENSERVNRQKQQDIRVVISNPPYSAQQESQNDNNQNLDYPTLDTRIRTTYAAQSSAQLLKNLYDSYIRAIRWASDRIRDKGVVAFVTNGSFIDANNMDGLRKCLIEEFSHLYVFNLRGNQRTAGEESRREGGKIFGSGSRAPIAISIMVKDSNHTSPCELRYYDIGDYLTREEKLAIIGDFDSIGEISWEHITPNSQGDWINQRNPVFETFLSLIDKDNEKHKSIFSVYSLGVGTSRDPWAYGFSRTTVASNIRGMIDNYNSEVDRYSRACNGKPKDQWPKLENFVDNNPTKISWSSTLLLQVLRKRKASFNATGIVTSMYRPFSKQWLYFDGMMNDRMGQTPRLFPTPIHENVVISVIGVVERKGFSTLVTNQLPNLHFLDTGQCFPLYWYEKSESEEKPQGDMFSSGEGPDVNGYICREAISDWALSIFREQYQDESIGKEDLFWYVYGILHSPEYKQRFAADLKKMLPRIPFACNFWAFNKAGRDLGRWHLDYETVEPWPLAEEERHLNLDPASFYRVTKMVFGKKNGKPDKSVIIYNGNVTLREIPPEAYDYVVNGKSAVEWIMERYAVTTDKASSIKNDPNAWSDDPRYIVDLLKRIVRVSIETVKIVNDLPALNESE